jgi:hypothetical protein
MAKKRSFAQVPVPDGWIEALAADVGRTATPEFIEAIDSLLAISKLLVGQDNAIDDAGEERKIWRDLAAGKPRPPYKGHVLRFASEDLARAVDLTKCGNAFEIVETANQIRAFAENVVTRWQKKTKNGRPPKIIRYVFQHAVRTTSKLGLSTRVPQKTDMVSDDQKFPLYLITVAVLGFILPNEYGAINCRKRGNIVENLNKAKRALKPLSA